MANIAGLGARMRLMALVTSFHARPVRSRGERIMFKVAMALDAESLLFRVKLMGNFHNPDVWQVNLFPSGDGGVAAQTVIGHNFITGKKFAGDDFPGPCMAIRTGHRFRMAAGGKPHLRGLQIAMTAKAEEGVVRSEAHQAQRRDGRQDQENRND
jgi:hypothetical protein